MRDVMWETPMEHRFELWEQFLQGQVTQPKDADKLKEKWAQRYVTEHYERLGFAKVQGPFNRGPDFKVFRAKRWQWAEVETRWRNYLEHGHQRSSAFKNTEFLILLSPEHPRPDCRAELPPRIVHIDLNHFLEWFTAIQQNSIRRNAIAGEMQAHWVTICPDKERDMAVCPNCHECPYFEAMFGEFEPHFYNLAAQFMVKYAIADSPEANLRKVRSDDLRLFTESQPPD
jgi:hypothetical protein